MTTKVDYSANREPMFTKEQVERWRRSRGQVTTSVRGNRVDVSVRLYRYGTIAWNVLLAVGAGCLVFVAYQVIYAMLSGRVSYVVDHLTKAID